MNSKHIILTACTALLCAVQAHAQGQNLPILTANTDARTAAMGNVSAAAEGRYLYDSPAAQTLPLHYTKRQRGLTEHSDSIQPP